MAVGGSENRGELIGIARERPIWKNGSITGVFRSPQLNKRLHGRIGWHLEKVEKSSINDQFKRRIVAQNILRFQRIRQGLLRPCLIYSSDYL